MADKKLIENLSILLRTNGLKLATAESCTGGLIASGITDLSGSSDIFDRGFVTYSNQAKIDMLGVSPATLDTYGAVSEQTASEMATGAINRSLADYSIAVTGIAGPTGGTADKPVGLVYIAIGQKGHPARVTKNIFAGDRTSVREQTSNTALTNLLNLIETSTK